MLQIQEYDAVKHPVMYASKKLLQREQNYPLGTREALAIIWAVNKSHRYLYYIEKKLLTAYLMLYKPKALKRQKIK